MKQHINKDNYNNKQQYRAATSALLASYINAAQQALAKYLQAKAEQLTKRKQKILLLLFSLLFGGGSIAIIFYSFTSINVPSHPPKITFPKYALAHASKPIVQDSLISHNEYARINQFRLYLERLQNDAEGKRIYDSLMQARPHLLDSIHQVDSIYLNQ